MNDAARLSQLVSAYIHLEIILEFHHPLLNNSLVKPCRRARILTPPDQAMPSIHPLRHSTSTYSVFGTSWEGNH